jgi:ABC-type microcin C transport system permease subunit YejE
MSLRMLYLHMYVQHVVLVGFVVIVVISLTYGCLGIDAVIRENV